MAILLSADGENDPDMLAINGASAALTRFRHSVAWPCRRRARGPRRRPVHRQPDPHPAQRKRSRPRLRRQRERTRHDRRQRQGNLRSRHDEGHRVRACGVKKIIAAIRELAQKAGKPKRTSSCTPCVRKFWPRPANSSAARFSGRFSPRANSLAKRRSCALKDKMAEGTQAEVSRRHRFRNQRIVPQNRVRSRSQLDSEEQQAARWPRRARHSSDLRRSRRAARARMARPFSSAARRRHW